VPLEPRTALAEWNGDKVTVWTGTQRPFGVRSEVASAFGIPEPSVRVLVPDTGSAYGGKHTGEYAVEAARLAKHVGTPVKLIWTREEEFIWAYRRPAGVIDVTSGLKSDGTLSAWEMHNYLSGPSGLDTPYEVANRRVQFHPVESPLREGSYRGLASTANHFARESHMDELATACGVDPVAFRLKHLKNERLQAVLKAATDRFGWAGRKTTRGTGFGVACGAEKGGYVACCAEIHVDPDHDIHVTRVVEAWDCGAIVNPDQLRNQVEGAIVMGLGGALYEAVEFANGRILNPRLSQYRVPRFRDVPKIEIVLLDRKDVPSAGAGEIPIVGIAPAIANALFHATGVRVRSMPILPDFHAQRA
jgi:isoquinoline 1-oxidoreductase